MLAREKRRAGALAGRGRGGALRPGQSPLLLPGFRSTFPVRGDSGPGPVSGPSPGPTARVPRPRGRRVGPRPPRGPTWAPGAPQGTRLPPRPRGRALQPRAARTRPRDPAADACGPAPPAAQRSPPQGPTSRDAALSGARQRLGGGSPEAGHRSPAPRYLRAGGWGRGLARGGAGRGRAPLSGFPPLPSLRRASGS